MRRARVRLFVIAGAALAHEGCVRHVYPYNHKKRHYRQGTYASAEDARTPGSLWSEGAHNLFEETRARRVGDILTVLVDERSDATRDTATGTQRRSDLSLGISAFLTAMQNFAATHPGVDPNALIQAASSSDFASKGATARSGALNATVPVRIREVLPNGDFFVEGNKVLLLNNEESYLYLSGVVRPIDVGTDNTVPSAVLADVELEYTGRGVLAENENPGWLSRIFSKIWPF